MSLNYFLVVCVGLLNIALARNIPNYIHICKRSDPHVAKCIRESVEKIRPQLKSGISELDVPGLDPLFLEEIAIFNGDGNSIRASLKNMIVHGAGDFQITKLKLDVEKNTYRVGVKFPKLVVEGDYDVDARVLVIPIQGAGKFYAEITDVDGQGVLKAEIVPRNGHREIRFTSFDFSIKVGDYDIKLDNLFNGDEVLSKAAMDVLHDNKQELIQVALPFIRSKAAEILLDAANKVTLDLDYDQVFPEK